MITNLTKKHCTPCEGGTPPLTADEVESYRAQTDDWKADEVKKTLTKSFTFSDFKEALGFVNRIGEIAEEEGHHPDILLHGYKNVDITLSTHAIGGLSENDFILAAKIDTL